MKKTILLALIIVAMGGIAQAQSQRDCNAIMQPYFTMHGINPDEYPAEKTEYRCMVSYYSFYIIDKVPSGSISFALTALTNLITGEHPADDFVPDVNTFCLYEWDFASFQKRFPKRTLYFELPDHTYLALRDYAEAVQMANDVFFNDK